MKKYFVAGLFTIMALVLSSYTFARQNKDSTYPLILNFYSIGTGVPDAKPLQQFISKYRKQNKLPVLKATLVGGLGREGEYAILFPLKELKTAQLKKFVSALSKALPTLKSKNEQGGINLTQNESFDASRSRASPELVSY